MARKMREVTEREKAAAVLNEAKTMMEEALAVRKDASESYEESLALLSKRDTLLPISIGLNLVLAILLSLVVLSGLLPGLLPGEDPFDNRLEIEVADVERRTKTTSFGDPIIYESPPPGVLVTRVGRRGPAARGESSPSMEPPIQRGDMIMQIHGVRLDNREAFLGLVKQLPAGVPIAMRVERPVFLPKRDKKGFWFVVKLLPEE